MSFSDNVIKYCFAGVPVLGNTQNGYSIGLSAQGESLCDAYIAGSISSKDIEAADSELYVHLVAGGYFEQGIVVNSIESAYLHVTQNCNLDCAGCYSLDNDRNTLPDAPVEQLKHVASELSSAGIRTLIISGGEPFLYADLVELLRYAKTECEIPDIRLATNGLFITEEKALEIQPFVDRVSVSIDGCNSKSHPFIRREQNFDTLIEKVVLLKSLSIPVQITPTIHAKNIDDLEEYARLAQDLDVTLNYSLLSCSPQSESLKELIPDKSLLEDLGKKLLFQSSSCSPVISNGSLGINMTTKDSCGAAKKTLSVAADGSVYPCHMLQYPDFRLGNLFNESLADIIARKEESELMNTLLKLNKTCVSCKFRWLCAGGCKARSYLISNNLADVDPYCPLYSSFYTHFSEYLKEKTGKEG